MVIDLYLTLLVKLCVLLLMYQTDAIDPDRELVYDGTIFAIFSASTNSIGQGAAGANCISWGGNIASINSQEEDAQLFSLTNATHFQCWIGLNRHTNAFLVAGNGNFTWEDGSDSTYRKFDTSVLTLQFFKFRRNNYSLSEEWADSIGNDYTNCYLCGKIANPRGCEFTNNGSCYRSFRVDPRVNWYDAQAACEDWGGNLASVTSKEENMLLFLRTPITALDCWVGMYYTDGNEDRIWNDGSGFIYDKLPFSQSTSPSGCIHWNQGGSNVWINANCNTSLLKCYVCKRNQTTVSISRVRYQLDIPSVFGYFYASWPGVTWNTALQECIGWGGSLASIESAAEDGTLYSLAAGNDTQCWIGLEISTRGSESIIWVDGSNSSYRNYPGQIPTITSIDKYYSLRSMNGSSGGGWNALNMAETLSCFYCEKLANQRGYDLTYNGSRYRTFETNNALNWNDSQTNCMSWGGDLASITSQQENDFLFLRTPYSAINCWIGLTDVNNNGVFQWIDGEQFTYDNWAGGTPNSDSTADCTQSKNGGNDEWENLQCNYLAKCHICKRDMGIPRNPKLKSEITVNGSIFSYYTTHRAGLFVGTAQLFQCINTGGNLATIDSAGVDQLLYDLAVSDDVECWIGLEKRTRGNETSIWADGSVSTYRNYPGQTPINDQITEFYSLRARNGNRTSGWEGYNPLETLSCFICQRPVNDRECEFTNDGFCYRTYLLVNPTINWFDAQSNCVMWGGNLASITSEDENTLLFLRTPYRADDCWIGLISTNMNNGAYHWIDGEMFSYDMWTSGAPTNIANTDDCARNKVPGKNEWNNYNCNSLTDSYICKRSSNAQFDPDLGELFGELINRNLGFKELKVNTILYRNITLICGDVINPSTSSINWIYSQNNNLSMNNTVNPTNFGSQPGITFISVYNSQQGFYQCRIQKQDGSSSLYTVGVFDLSVTTVAEGGRTYNYTIGIDRADILLLCVPMNNSINPINYIWRIGVSLTKNNPILVPSLPSSSFNFVCEVFGTDVLSISLIVREPSFTVTYNPSVSQTYTQLYPNTIQFSYQGLPQDFTLSSNIEGRWKLPDGTYQAGSSVTFPYLLQQYTGLYTFYLYNWEGVEVPAFRINVATHNLIGSFITDDTTYVSDSLANGSSLFITENITTVLCVGPNATTAVEWYIHSELNSNKTQLSTGVGVTRYNIDIINVTTPIYLTCEVDESETYTIFVARRDSIIQVINFDEAFSYTSGSSEMLYYTNPSIPNSLIHWTTESVMEGDNQTFNPEFQNPFPLSLLFSVVGAGQHTLTCFYRNSPAMVLGRTDLSVRDTTTVTLSYNGSQTTFSDETNPSFPTPVPIDIQLPTYNVMFACSLQECIWRIVYTNSTIRMVNSSMYTIDVLSLEDAGIYSLFRTTDTGNTYITALISMNVLPAASTIASIFTTPASSVTQISSTGISERTATPSASVTPMVPTTQPMPPMSNETLSSFNPIIVAVPIIITIVALIIISVVLICVLIYVRRRKNDGSLSKKYSRDESDTTSKTPLEVLGQENLSYSPRGSIKMDHSLYANVKSENVVPHPLPEKDISETRFGSDANYQNFIPSKVDDNTYEVPQTTDPRLKPIPLDVFKIHVNKLWRKEKALEDEYESFGGKGHRYPCIVGTIDSNRVKNRFKLIYPYDKSRVVLQVGSEANGSDYINASHIPGIYVKNNFIVAQAPKDSTLTNFWQMIIQNKILNIVMVTNLVESGRSKCEPYYPQKEGETLVVGPYLITLQREEVRIGYTIRYIIAIHNDVKTKIKHFHFTSWPDHDVPSLYDEMLLFVGRVHKGLIQTDSPILVHCSAGVGRSGTFLALYNLHAAIQKGEAICIYKLVQEMREHRPQMVQTFSQYKFIYLAVLEMLLGKTSIETDEFMSTFQLYMQSETEGYVSVFFQQYSELNYQCEKGFELVCKVAKDQHNNDKNPIRSTLPCDNNRVVLLSSHFNCGYINATIFEDINCIVTINPTANTLLDFMQLIYQSGPSLVVFLATSIEYQQILAGKSDRVVYWPRQGKDFDADLFTMTSLSSENVSPFISNDISLNNVIDDKEKQFNQLISTAWNEKDEPDLENIVILLQAILQHKQEHPGSPILVHCSDGAGKSGILLTVYKAILDSREKNFIDIFHIVKKFRSERMNFIPTLTHFVSCFALMNEFCSNAV